MTPRRIIFTALLPFAVGYLMSYLLRTVNAVVAPDLVRDLHLSPGELGLLTAAYLGAFALFQLPLGVLLDAYGPRKVQAAMLALSAAGCLWFAWASTFAGLFAARAIIGLGFSAGLMAAYKSSATWVPIARRSLANTSIMAAGAVGVVAATEPTEYLVGLVGWRNAFIVFAIAILATAGMVLALAPRNDTVKDPTPFGRQLAETAQIMRRPLFWRVAPLLALTSGIQVGIQTLWAGPWLRDVMGLSRPEVASHLLILAIAFVVGILSVGIIADWLGRRGIGAMQVLLGFNVVYFIAQALIIFRVPYLMFPAWIAVAAFGQVAVLAYPWFTAHIGKDLAGRANATLNFALFVAAFASQYFLGFVIGLFPASADAYEPAGYSWAIGLFLVAQLVAFVWYLLDSPHKDRTA